MTKSLEWEEIARSRNDRIERTPVPGGWIYKVADHLHFAVCFVPDPEVVAEVDPKVKQMLDQVIHSDPEPAAEP